jgi:hypothetical protein
LYIGIKNNIKRDRSFVICHFIHPKYILTSSYLKMLSRVAAFVFVASLICVALASPMGELQKRASSTISAPASTKAATSAPTPMAAASAIYPDYSKITSKKTDPLNDGWKGMADQASGTKFW